VTAKRRYLDKSMLWRTNCQHSPWRHFGV